MKYVFYEELREHMGRLYRKASGKSKAKAMQEGDPVSAALRWFFAQPESGKTIDSAVLIDEEDYIVSGRRMYIPKMEELVKVLWRAKMKVELSDLQSFARVFSVAWPQGTVIEGVTLPGCLVWFGTKQQREKIRPLIEKWVGHEIEFVTTGYNAPRDELLLHVMYSRGDGGNRMYYRCSIPEPWVKDCLVSADALWKKVGTYHAIAVQPLTEQERFEQYVLLKTVLHLMVYATACPEAVKAGWPDSTNVS